MRNKLTITQYLFYNLPLFHYYLWDYYPRILTGETMKFTKNIAIITTLGLLTVGGLTACTTNPYTGEQQLSKAGAGAGLGAASGAIIGGLIGHNATGALIGAGVGGVTGAIIGGSLDKQDAELRQRLEGTGVRVIKEGNSIQLSMASDVTFATDSADIRSAFYPALSSVAIVLNKYNNTNIVVSGFTDNTGTADYNQRLSEERARSVGNFLMSQGVNPDRVFTRGFGMRHPIASNATPAGRSLNRRVVITVRPMGR
jgi:outer membrane protein OmpA-like peptidoglycan-associated protein